MTSRLCFIFLLLNMSSAAAQFQLSTIDSIVNSAIANNQFEGTILIADQGNTIYQKSHGFANREKQIKIKDNSIHRIASITKMITAIITLQLIEEGHFTTETTLNILLPEFAIPKSKKITVHHLLLHISGLPNENGLIYTRPKTATEMINETLASEKSKSKFGEYQYNNIDYILLGLIIEKFTGQPWRDVVQQRIINTLDLNQTGFLENGNEPDNFVLTYQVNDDGRFTEDPTYHIENFYAAACMYSTASDLLKIDQAMYTDDLLSDKSKATMFTSYPEYNYTGYSVWTYDYPFAKGYPKVMERRGGILGANVVVLRILSLNRTIIILSNNNRFNPDTFGDTTSLREALLIELAKK